MTEFIAARVKEEVSLTVRDRDVLETESAGRVFEKAYGWFQKLGSFAAVVFALVGSVLVYTVVDWKSGVKQAKEAVAESAKTASGQISATVDVANRTISKASKDAIDSSERSSADVVRASDKAKYSAEQTRVRVQKEEGTLERDLALTRSELKTANELRPAMERIQGELTVATNQLAAQQKILSNTKELARYILGSRKFLDFPLTNFRQSNLVVVPSLLPNKDTVVYVLLPDVPINPTIQLQIGTSVQPSSSMQQIKNLIVFFWSNSLDELKSKPLSFSFSPDDTDQDVFHKLSVHDGRVYADQQPFDFGNESLAPIAKH